MKKILIAIPLLILLGLGFYAYQWESPDVNRAHTKSAHQALYESDYYLLSFTTMGNQFVIAVAPHAPEDAVNPHFPIAHIRTSAPHNAWLHLVRTDSNNIKLQRFIDSAENEEELFPFYSFEQDFYDSPIWRYGLFNKPLSFWNGYAYAVQVDREAKTIKCVGGLAWGFTLAPYAIRPQDIHPKPLTEAEWKRDWLFFQQELKDFTLVD